MWEPPKTCPNCGSSDVRPFTPTAFGYYCGDCNHDWDDPPKDED